MPLTGTGPVLGVALAAGSGSVDGAGISAWLAIANVCASWLPANVKVAPGAMVAAAGKVTGAGTFTYESGEEFGAQLAVAAGVRDEAGRSHWRAIGTAILSHLKSSGQALPTLFAVAQPQQGGPVTGTGNMQFSGAPIGPRLADAAGSVDAGGVAAWAAIGVALLTHLAATAIVLATPIGLVAPPGGGALTGSGSIQ